MPRRVKTQRGRGARRARNRRLNAFCDKILENVALDFRKPELRDIQSAVEEMLNNIVAGVNERGLFKVARIQQCGSIAEQTSMMKSDADSHSNYIEFDYLAVLEKTEDLEIKPGCGGCMTLSKGPFNEKLIETYNYVKFYESFGSLNRIAARELFTRETCVVACSFCSCYQFKCLETAFGSYSFEPIPKGNKSACDKCCIAKESGKLSIAHSVTFGDQQEYECCLFLVWNSYDKSLYSTDTGTLERSHAIEKLFVSIDFLPAVEILKSSLCAKEKEHDCFLVPKSCPTSSFCGMFDKWRVSDCLTEIDMFLTKMHDIHRKSYKILKFLFEYYPYSYTIKIATLKHNINHKSPSSHVQFVTAILYELIGSYKRLELLTPHRGCNLITPFDDWHYELLKSKE